VPPASSVEMSQTNGPHGDVAIIFLQNVRMSKSVNSATQRNTKTLKYVAVSYIYWTMHLCNS